MYQEFPFLCVPQQRLKLFVSNSYFCLSFFFFFVDCRCWSVSTWGIPFRDYKWNQSWSICTVIIREKSIYPTVIHLHTCISSLPLLHLYGFQFILRCAFHLRYFCWLQLTFPSTYIHTYIRTHQAPKRRDRIGCDFVGEICRHWRYHSSKSGKQSVEMDVVLVVCMGRAWEQLFKMSLGGWLFAHYKRYIWRIIPSPSPPTLTISK